MVDVQTHRAQFGQCQRLQQQVDDFDVGLDAGMAVDLGTDLDGSREPSWPLGRVRSTEAA